MAEVAHPLSEYASSQMVELWGDKWAARNERKLWLAVMRYQYLHGVFSEVDDYERKYGAYKATQNDVRLWVIRDIEMRTKHDLKARIEAYNQVASERYGEDLELIHWGMTSADIVENMALLRLQYALDILGHHKAAYDIPFRGIKGPVGTSQDQLDLLGSEGACVEMDKRIAKHFGFREVLHNVGQVAHRSIDFQAAAAALNHIRGREWCTIARGYFQMIGEYQGSTWNEGDVMSSSIRRVALPGLFLAADADRMERGA